MVQEFPPITIECLIIALEELLPAYTNKQEWLMVQKISESLNKIKLKQNSQLSLFHASTNATANVEEKLNLMEVKNAV